MRPVFNILILIPLGIYLRYYFKKDLKHTIFICFFVSLFFEITQITALYGFYNAPYRLFDVDDLILNTFGGYIGYKIAPLFKYFFPITSNFDKNVNLEGVSVSYFRRMLAFIIDWMIINCIINIFGIQKNVVSYTILIFIYFILGVYLSNGKTIGKAVLKMKIKGEGSKITFKQVFVRYGLLYYIVFGINYIFKQGIVVNQNNYIVFTVIVFIIIIFDLFIILHFLVHVFKKDKLLFYEKISDTKNIV